MKAWKFEYQSCKLGIQHIWWAVHILDIICLLSGTTLFIAHTRDEQRNKEKAEAMQRELDKGKKLN